MLLMADMQGVSALVCHPTYHGYLWSRRMSICSG